MVPILDRGLLEACHIKLNLAEYDPFSYGGFLGTSLDMETSGVTAVLEASRTPVVVLGFGT